MNIDPDKRQKVLIIATVAIAAVFLGDRLIVGPLMKSWQARSERITALKKDLVKGRQLLERKDTVLSRWQEMQSNALPVVISEAEGRVLEALDRWSRSSSVNITSVKPQWKQMEDGYMTFECRVDASGNLGTLTKFLYEVERDPLALRVEAIELAARDNTASELNLGLQVSGLVLNPPTQR